ncbi:MAG: PA14 domain-containing protein [Kiritimatiellaeota bacterium]|nr:PA14 domain-containing protein [Kiritimatiellota bacterium]
MKNEVSPNAICGGAPWAFEVWVYKEQIYSDWEVVFAWTARNQWLNNQAAGTCMEFRYGRDPGNAVEHYDGAYNLSWGGDVPPVGQWHHVAVTRDAAGTERLFLNGEMRVTRALPSLNIRDDVGFFTLGAAQNLDNGNWDMGFRGSVACLRIYDGPLSIEEVATSYAADCAAFGFTPVVSTVKFWKGTAGAWAPWDTAGNWIGGVPVDGDHVYFDNGGKATNFTASLTLSDFQGYDGGLHMASGSLSVLDGRDRVIAMGEGPGRTFDFLMEGGKLETPRGIRGNRDVHFGKDGGYAEAVIGGGPGQAWLCAESDIVVGIGNAGHAQMTILQNGLVTVSNGNFFVTANGAATGTVVVAGGTLRNEREGALNVSQGTGAQGRLVINDGTVGPFGDLWLVSNNPNQDNLGEVFLNGGLLWVRRVEGNPAGTRTVFFNGGTLRNRDSRENFMQNITGAIVQEGGARFDIIAGTTVHVWQPLEDDPAGPGGGLTKTGPGTLILRNWNTFTGSVHVAQGNLLFQNADGLPPGYDGTILLENGGGIGWEATGGATALAGLMDPASDGSVILYGANAGDDVDLSAHPGVSLGAYGMVDYTGTYTPYNNEYRFFLANGGIQIYREQIASGSVTLMEGSSGFLDIHGDNAYTGGTTINGGTLVIYHVNALGPYQPGVKDIGIYNGAALMINTGLNQSEVDQFISRIKTDSSGALLLGNPVKDRDINLTGLPGISLGADNNTAGVYAGTLTPDPSVGYHLGGGRNDWDNSGMWFSNLTGPLGVLMDIPGSALLHTNNTFTGTITVTNRAVLYVQNDGGFGTEPPAPVPDYLHISGGIFRPAPDVPYAASHPNRGLEVGGGGATFCIAGDRYWTWQGDLSGSGPIVNQDRGVMIFGGAANTWDGTLNLNNEIGTFAVGHGANFSWVKTNLIQGSGYFGVATDQDVTWSGAFENPLGNVPPQYDAPDGTGAWLGLHKLGAGTLTLDVPNTYRRDTRVESGTLKVNAENAIPWNWEHGNLDFGVAGIFPRGVLDLNGFDVNVNGLWGAGTVTNSQGGVQALIAGNADRDGAFFGTVAPPVKIVKVGNQDLRFWKGADIAALEVQRGAALAGAGTTFGDIALTVTIDPRSTFFAGLSADDAYGLMGEYYNFNYPERRDLVTPGILPDLAAFEDLLAPLAPTTVASSWSFGDGFDAGAEGTRFQGNFYTREYFYARWTGEFYAEADGLYGFATASDDGSVVYLNRDLIVTNDFMQAYDLFGGKRGGEVWLEQGWHDILIGFHQGAVGRGLTVFMTPPGGAEDVLPQALLRPYPVTAASIAGGPGTRVEVLGNAALEITGDAPSTYWGDLASAATDARFIKGGGGDLTFAKQWAPAFNGQVIVREGRVGLFEAAPFAKPVTIEGGGALFVEPDRTDWGNRGMKASFYWGWNYGGTSFEGLDNDFGSRTPDAVYNTTQAGPDALPTAVNFFYESGLHFPGPFSEAYPPEGEKQNFSARFQGKFLALEPGEYVFGLSTDDRGDLFVNGVQVLDNVQWDSGIKRTDPIHLDVGTHDLQIAWGQGGGGYRVNLFVTPPDGIERPMPNAWLRPGASTAYGVRGAGTLEMPYAGSYLALRIEEPVTFAGSVTGAPGSEIEKNGADTLTLTGDNDAFGGTWYVLKGTLVAGDGGTGGTLGGAGVYVGTGGLLVFDRADDIIYTGRISGKGEVRAVGAGRVTLTDVAGDFEGAFTSGTFIFSGAAASIQADRLAQGPDPLFAHFEDGAELALPYPSGGGAPLTLPPLVFSNATFALPLTDNASYYVDSLMVEAGSSVQFSMRESSGLIGYYYDLNGRIEQDVTDAYMALDTAEDYLKGFPLILKASSCDAGDFMWFGDDGDPASLRFPQEIIDKHSYFGVIWKGKIRITDPGEYTFWTDSDDHSMIFINDTLVADNNGGHGMDANRCVSTPIELAAGLHDFALVFQQGEGGYGLNVGITFPGQPNREPLPNSMLIADPMDILDMPGGLPGAEQATGMTFTLEVGTLGVINGPGTGTVDVTGVSGALNGTLLLNDLYIEAPGAILAAKGETLLSGSNLHVVIGEEPPLDITVKIGDFSETPYGLPLSGKTKSLTGGGKRGKLFYQEATKSLYLSTRDPTILILR